MSVHKELERSILDRIKHLNEKNSKLEEENANLNITLNDLKQALEGVNDRSKKEDVSEIKNELDAYSKQINDCLEIVNQLANEYDGNE